MKYSKYLGRYRIESTRLPYWDYSNQGYYFITICVKNRICDLGQIVNGKMQLSPLGQIVKKCWRDLTKHYCDCRLDAFVIMPNHVHGIIRINARYNCNRRPVEAGFKPASTGFALNQRHFNDYPTGRYSVSEIIRGFKTFSARRINQHRGTLGRQFWQSRFHDHIIRNEESLYKIRMYIKNNPINWLKDRNNSNDAD